MREAFNILMRLFLFSFAKLSYSKPMFWETLRRHSPHSVAKKDTTVQAEKQRQSLGTEQKAHRTAQTAAWPHKWLARPCQNGRASRLRRLSAVGRRGLSGTPALPLSAVLGKEITTQHTRDTNQHVGVDTPAFKQTVNVRPVEVQLFCQPTDGAPLATKFLLDDATNMNHGR